MRGGQWLTLCGYLPCLLVLLLCPNPTKSGWSPWSDTVCYRQPGSDGRNCLARQQRNCVCHTVSHPTCPCQTTTKRLTYPPGSAQFCTSDCQAFGTWCPWSHWYQSERSSCHVTVIERTRKCCGENSHVSVDLNRCAKFDLSNAIERRLRYVYNCTTSPMGRLAGVFGTVFVIVCILTVIVLLRLRARRRHLRIMAQRSRSAQDNDACANADLPYIIPNPAGNPYANVRAPVMPPSYSEVQPLPPPPPYELNVSPGAQASTAANNAKSEA